MNDEDDYDYDPDDDHGINEPIGSCEECKCDLYKDDCYIDHDEELCGQCYWRRTQV